MISTRLVQLIEGHSEQITQRMLEAIRKDPRLPLFSQLPDSELLRRFDDACQHLGRWLAAKDEKLMEVRYTILGRERFEENIPLHEVVRAVQVLKREILKFARQQAVDQSALEIYGEKELEHLVGGFYDRIVYYIVQGYERALRESTQQAVSG